MKLSEIMTSVGVAAEDDLSIKNITELLREINKMGLMKQNQNGAEAGRGNSPPPRIVEGRIVEQPRAPPQLPGVPTDEDGINSQEKKQEPQLSKPMQLDDAKLDEELLKVLDAYGSHPLIGQISVGQAMEQLKGNTGYRAELIKIVKEAVRRASE